MQSMNEKDKDLDQLWKKYAEDAANRRLSQEQIAVMMRSKIAQPVKTMQSSLIADLVICAGIGAWIIYSGIKRWGDWPYLLVSGLLAALLVYSIWCILRAYQRLQRVSHQDPVTLIDALRLSLAKIHAESRFSTGSVLIMILTGLSVMILIHTYYAHRQGGTAKTRA